MTDDPVERLRTDIAELRHDLHTLGLDSATVRAKLDNLERDVSRLVPIDRFALVEKVVYGTVGLILLSFLGVLVNLVMQK